MGLCYSSSLKIEQLKFKPLKHKFAGICKGYNQEVLVYELNESKGYQSNFKPIINYYFISYKEQDGELKPYSLINTRVKKKYENFISNIKQNGLKEIDGDVV